MQNKIEVVIKIRETEYEYIMEYGGEKDIDGWNYLENAVKNGTPLPKGHGRLIDAERLLTVIHRNTVGDLFDQLIDMQPTIIEADTESEESE